MAAAAAAVEGWGVGVMVVEGKAERVEGVRAVAGKAAMAVGKRVEVVRVAAVWGVWGEVERAEGAEAAAGWVGLMAEEATVTATTGVGVARLAWVWLVVAGD